MGLAGNAALVAGWLGRRLATAAAAEGQPGRALRSLCAAALPLSDLSGRPGPNNARPGPPSARQPSLEARDAAKSEKNEPSQSGCYLLGATPLSRAALLRAASARAAPAHDTTQAAGPARLLAHGEGRARHQQAHWGSLTAERAAI